jgi:hypothetical protein
MFRYVITVYYVKLSRLSDADCTHSINGKIPIARSSVTSVSNIAAHRQCSEIQPNHERPSVPELLRIPFNCLPIVFVPVR